MRAFVTLPGQFDNIGDTLHRRVLLDWLREFADLNLYVGSAPDSFISGMGVRSEDVIQRSLRDFLLSASSASRASGNDVLFVFNPGEIRLGRQRTIREIGLAPLLWRLRVNGGQVVRAGVATGTTDSVAGKIAGWTLGRALSKADVLSWRESTPQEAYGIGDLVPDFGFAVKGDGFAIGQSSRNIMALTMRFDRPMLSSSSITAIKRAAREAQLDIVVVSQVRRDNDRSARLAKLLDGTLDPWPDDRNHEDHEVHLRRVYAQSKLIVSDRLHALIAAGTEGAAVYGLAPQNSDKLRKHFGVIGLEVGQVAAEMSEDDLVATMTEATLNQMYQNEAFARAHKDVRAWLSTTRERLQAKCGDLS